MTEPSEFVLFTSIPPRLSRLRNGRQVGSTYQHACVESWISAGFTVVSVNAATEVDAVHSLKFPVSVVGVKTPNRPLISDILALASASGARMCGIINADCRLIGYSKVAAVLSRHVEGSLILAERIDIDNDTELPVLGTTGGFDAFFFQPPSVVGVSNTYFHLGDPWWDFWFPVELASRGILLQRLTTPIISHLLHPRVWTESRQENGEYFLNYIQRLVAGGQTPLGLPKMDEDLEVVWRWLRQKPEREPIRFFDRDLAGYEELLASLRESHLVGGRTFRINIGLLKKRLASLGADLARAEREKTRAERGKARAERETRRLSRKLRAVYESSSWRATSPLRAVRRMLFREP